MATIRPAKPQLYKDVLTLTLHTRFIRAAGVILGLCYVLSVLMSDWSWFWSWFPLGPTGFRMILLFLSAQMIFILRVAQMHKTYLWSASDESNLALRAQTNQKRPYERPQLNERPLYFRSAFVFLAFFQSFVHLINDYDRISLPVPKPSSKSPADPITYRSSSPYDQILRGLLRRVPAGLFRCLSMVIFGPIIYSLFFRRMIWDWTFTFVKPFLGLPRSSALLPSYPPFYSMWLIIRLVCGSFMLVFLWEASVVAFEATFAQEPLKQDIPLTTTSKDPNGTLVTGLKSKRDVPQTFAFWELLLISDRFPVRRRTIYEELDRRDGSTWTQMLNSSMDIIQGLNTRVLSTLNPSQTTPTTTTSTARPPPSQSNAIQTLPRISNVPTKHDPIVRGPPPPTRQREKLQSRLGEFSKSVGQTPAPTTTNPSTPLALIQRISHFLINTLLTQDQQQNLSKSYFVQAMRVYALDFLKSSIGKPFRQTLRKRSRGIILGSGRNASSGSGYDVGLLIHAIASITNLVTNSIDEDPYGKVQGDVPEVIRSFTATIRNLEGLEKRGLKRHWTDVDVGKRRGGGWWRWFWGGNDTDEDSGDELEEVHLVLRALKIGLGRMVETFAKYGDVLGLDGRDVRAAREAARFDDDDKEKEKEGGRRESGGGGGGGRAGGQGGGRATATANGRMR
ncbi:MAG: hypothetical protein M1823_000610 [Watsoniomyces obsoletus]|nr:MAG: hypothetical protein M1823_000610 [Watsoniomyces obsoletus]